MDAQLTTKILARYGIKPAEFLESAKGYRNLSQPVLTTDNKIVNIILFKREPHALRTIQTANMVGDFLANQGLPARAAYDPRILSLQHSGYVRYVGLYRYLPGSTIPWEGYTMKHIKAVGAMMRTMHDALVTLPGPEKLPLVTDEYGTQLERMQHYFTDKGVVDAMHTKLGLNAPELKRYEKILEAVERSPAGQPLHMDFVRGNILFEGIVISGIIDFEKAAYGHPLFDIARTLAFLLVDCKYKTEAQVRKYFLRSGYYKLPGRPIYSERLLEVLMDFFLLHDFYKFLKHNPYESLMLNEHFVRTRNFLLERAVLSRA